LPTWTPELDAEMAKASAQIIAEAKAAANAPPPDTDKGADAVNPAQTPDKGESSVEGSVSNTPASGTDKGDVAPPTPPSELDLTFLPEDVRSEIQIKTEKAYAAIKAGWETRGESTKRWMEAADMRKAAEADKRDAENYRALLNDPAKGISVLQAAMGGPAEPAAPAAAEAPPDPVLDPAAFQAWLDKRDEDREARILTKVREERERPNVLRNAVNDALTAYAEENAVDQAVMEAAVKAADASLRARGKVWNPDQVPVLMDGFIASARAKAPATPTPAPTNGHAGTTEVVSPVGRGGPHQANLVPVPHFFVNGSPPNRDLTNDEMEQVGLYATRKHLGPGVTLEEYRAVSGGRFRS
jgi:hypothetical protein